MAKVIIGTPVRNRGWILPRYLSHMDALDHPERDFLFVVNDCVDDTKEILRGYPTVEMDTGYPKWLRDNIGYSFQNLASLRNRLIEEFLRTDAEYLFSVDSDILVPGDSLSRLIANGKDICSAILCNEPGNEKNKAHNVMLRKPKHQAGHEYYHMKPYPKDSLFEVDLTGACYLIHRRVLEAGARYGYHTQGEDAAFCRSAKDLGFSLWCDSRVKPIHVMAEGQELSPEY